MLDLFCKAGGASFGYHLAGFEVVGVDIEPQKNYPFEFHCADALTFPLDGFDLLAGSPPCQSFSNAQRIQNREHPELIEPIRERFIESGIPYVIENVVGAPLINPTLLCGEMFGIENYRHRLFETSFPLPLMLHPEHIHPQAKMGRMPKKGEYIQAVGNFAGVDIARQALGVHWMTRDEIRESIPPVFTKFIGEVFRAQLPSLAATGTDG